MTHFYSKFPHILLPVTFLRYYRLSKHSLAQFVILLGEYSCNNQFVSRGMMSENQLFYVPMEPARWLTIIIQSLVLVILPDCEMFIIFLLWRPDNIPQKSTAWLFRINLYLGLLRKFPWLFTLMYWVEVKTSDPWAYVIIHLEKWACESCFLRTLSAWCSFLYKRVLWRGLALFIQRSFSSSYVSLISGDTKNPPLFEPSRCPRGWWHLLVSLLTWGYCCFVTSTHPYIHTVKN